MCSGCFDPLHVGHIRHLKEARARGGRLIVSVTGDRFISKGVGRPAFGQVYRKEAVEALRWVDEAVINDAPDCVDVILRFKPDFYAKGLDYESFRSASLQREKEAVESYGGRLIFIGERITSSTEILQDTGTLLFIRGEPGSGKITVARILEQRLGWKLFWLHDLDGIVKIVGGNKIPRLMDDITKPVITHLIREHKNLIYVRPARDKETVEEVKSLAAKLGVKVNLVRLTASFDSLVYRVEQRDEASYRLSSKIELEEYLKARPLAEVEGEVVIGTDNDTPQQTANRIEALL